MNPREIKACLEEVNSTIEPSQRVLGMARLLGNLFAERGKRIVVVGGSAIEVLTEGRYTSGDVDICFLSTRPTMRVIAEVMGEIGAEGGIRSFRKGEMFIDILGSVESLARTPFRDIGGVLIAKPEDLIAERVLMSVYPQPNEDARLCAEKLLWVAMSGELPVDWDEAVRVAELPEYEIAEELNAMREDLATRHNRGQKR